MKSGLVRVMKHRRQGARTPLMIARLRQRLASFAELLPVRACRLDNSPQAEETSPLLFGHDSNPTGPMIGISSCPKARTIKRRRRLSQQSRRTAMAKAIAAFSVFPALI